MRSVVVPLVLTAALTSFAAPVEPREAVPFIHDDYARALQQARAKGLPLFVDAWAPW